jgi:hypothetical protein
MACKASAMARATPHMGVTHESLIAALARFVPLVTGRKFGDVAKGDPVILSFPAEQTIALAQG